MFEGGKSRKERSKPGTGLYGRIAGAVVEEDPDRLLRLERRLRRGEVGLLLDRVVGQGHAGDAR